MTKTSENTERESLLQTTIRLLKHRDRTITLTMLAEKCDCSVPFLSSLVSDNPPRRPGVNAIQRLYETLSGQPLDY